MKIEDINYTLPTAQISKKDFDKEKWLQENPIDYFKLIYLLLSQTNNAPVNIPRSVATDTVFRVLYTVTQFYIPDTLYKFYSLTSDEALNEKKFTTLKHRKIFMSDIKDFNDPFDGRAFYYNFDELKYIKILKPNNGRLIDSFSAYYKCTAFTENDTSCMPMWAHYANNHQGFCAAYDLKNPSNAILLSCTFPVQYADERLDITSFMKKYANMIALNIEKHIYSGGKNAIIDDYSLVYIAQLLNNIKHSSWSYEKEFRCTISARAKGAPYVDATPKAIYIGMNCSKQNCNKLISIAQELLIPIYQMGFNELSEKYVLVEKQLSV